MVYFVYLLECYKKEKLRAFYIGQTNNVDRRFSQHKKNIENKKTKTFTGRFDKVKLVWYTECETREEAKRWEREIIKVKNIVKNDSKKIN